MSQPRRATIEKALELSENFFPSNGQSIVPEAGGRVDGEQLCIGFGIPGRPCMVHSFGELYQLLAIGGRGLCCKGYRSEADGECHESQ
jgi:hypothetical protein